MDEGDRTLIPWTTQLNVARTVCFLLCDFYHNKKLEKENTKKQ